MSQVCRRGFPSIAALTVLLVVVDARAAAPPPTDPEGMSMGLLPGTFPTTVNGANMNVEQFTPAVFAGAGSDNLRVSFPAAGPIKWTESRHNEGDIALLIGPGDPSDPDYFPPTTFFNNYRPLAGDPAFSKSTIGWRVSRATGAALATVRHNGVNWGPDFTFAGNAVGTIHGVAYFNATGAQGWGYRMDDGEFRNGGGTATDLQMGIAGFDNTQGESSSSVAVAYFPYEQGWTGAWVNSGTDGEATYANSSPGLPTSAVNYTGTVAFVKLPDVDSDTDGMLFVAPTHDANRTNIAAAFPNNDGWTVSVREDDNAIFSGDATSLVPGTENGFQFLYVPYSAPGLIGGHVNGATGALIQSSGDAQFDVTRTSAGQYAVSVYAADGVTKLSENDGILVMSVAGSMAGQPTLADRAFLSYQFSPAAGDYNNSGSVDAADYVAWRNAGATDTLPNDPTPGTVDASDYTTWAANYGQGGEFIVQSRHLAAIGSPLSENQFGDDLALRDADFYLAWVSFTNPLSPGVVDGSAIGSHAVPEPASGVLGIAVFVLTGAVRVRSQRK